MAPRDIGPLPLPGSDLQDHDLPLVEYAESLYRIHRSDQDPEFWGKTGDNRFDAPGGEFGVLYTASDQHGAFVETCGVSLNRTLTLDYLRVRSWARVIPSRALRLVDLSGPGLAHIRADERLCSGEHGVAQQWALALWQHEAIADGLLYRARHDPSRKSVALFDRARTVVKIIGDGELLSDGNKPLLATILDTYRFSLL